MSASLVARMLGNRFGKLHPAVRERHGFDSSSGVHSVGIGVMDRVWHSTSLFVPFLRIGSRRRIMFPESGTDVPFRIECWAYVDSLGRETLSLNRSFEFDTLRRFDEYVVMAPGAQRLLIYVGSHQHLVADLTVQATPRGGLEFSTGAQRLLTRGPAIRFPRILSASAHVEEWFDETEGRFRIEARVRNRFFGEVLGCVGSFESAVRRIPESGVPAEIRPIHEEARR